MRKILYFIGYLIAFAIIFYAPSVLAATPQEILNSSLAKFDTDNGINITGELNVDVMENRWVKTQTSEPEKASLKFNFTQRSLPKIDGRQDGEGSLTLLKAYIADQFEEFEIKEPITISWRTVAPMSYVKVEKLPESVSKTFTELGVPLDDMTQHWIEFESSGDKSLAQEVLPVLPKATAEPSNEVLNTFTNLGEKQFLTITKTEKTYKNNKGQDIVRVRVGINKNLLYQEYQKELQAAYKIKDYTERTAAIKTARDEYQENLKDIIKLHMAANINVTTQKLERFEFGFVQTDPKEDCTWNDDYSKQTCKQIGTTTVTMGGGFWLHELDLSPIYIPYNAMKF